MEPSDIEWDISVFRGRLSDAGLGELKIFIENRRDALLWREGLKQMAQEGSEWSFEAWRACVALRAVREVESQLAVHRKCGAHPVSAKVEGEWCRVSYFMVAGKLPSYVVCC